MSQRTKIDGPARLMTVDAIRERFNDGTWNFEDRDWLLARAEGRPMPRIASDEIRETPFEYDDDGARLNSAPAMWECAKWLRAMTAELRDLNNSLTLAWNALEAIYNKLEEKKPN